MKIKSIEVIFTWEDGSTNEVSNYLPDGTNRDLEDFADYWEAEHGENEITSIDVSECEAKPGDEDSFSNLD